MPSSAMPRSNVFTIRSEVPFRMIALSNARGEARDLPVPNGSAKIVTMLLLDRELDGPLGVSIGLVSGELKSMQVNEGGSSADFGDPLATKTPTIVWELGALAAGALVVWLLMADRKKGRR